MPFYRTCSGTLKPSFILLKHSFTHILINSTPKYRKEKSRGTQQAHTQITETVFFGFRPGKRAWVSSFPHTSGYRASLTVEAALALPVILFAMYLLIFPLRVMEAERRLQNRMETAAKQMTLEGYIEKTGKKLLKDKEVSGTVENLAEGLKEGVVTGYILAAPETGLMEHMRFDDKTSVLSGENGADAAMVHLELEYRPQYPMTFFNFAAPDKVLVSHRRAWVGSAGGRGRDQYGMPLEEEEDEEDRIVYLGKTSTVYHEDPRCHYLSNDLMTADASQMKELRNASGAKYHACPSCRPSGSGAVYYSASGTAYHSSPDCKAITAYARAVHYHEVEGMRACSYCGRH